VEIAKKIAGVLSVIVGSSFGIIGLAWSQLLFSVVALVINTTPSRRYFHCGLGSQLYDLKGVAGATAIMGAGVYLLRHVLFAGPLLELTGCLVAGCFIYLATGFAFRVQAVSEAFTMLKATRSSQH
jgi:hypothetical protein